MSLTPRMRETLRMMARGWLLCHDTRPRGRCWLQLGLAATDCHGQTMNALWHRGFLEIKRQTADVDTFQLSDAGRAAAEMEDHS